MFRPVFRPVAPAVLVVLALVGAAPADLVLGPEQLIQAGGGNLAVSGYSVPSLADWDNDGRLDLVVGQGSSAFPGKVRVYPNLGTPQDPQFNTYSFAQSNGADLSVPGSGCLGAFPRCSYWNGDGLKDLLVGRADGTVSLFTNVGSDTAPAFDAGAFLQVGQPGSKVNINVGGRATAGPVDWNSDGRKDLVVGGLDGKIRVYLNEGTDTAPDFLATGYAMLNGSPLVVPSGRASPVVMDFDNDGRKDLVTGNTDGQLLLYLNTGTDQSPAFSNSTVVLADGVPIDLAGTPRSRPFVGDYNADGISDVLIGAGDGYVHLYLGVPEPGTAMLLLGVAVWIRRR